MKKTISGFAMWTCVIVASLAVMPAQAGVLDSLLLAGEVRILRAKVAAGGPVDARKLEDAIAEGGSAGLDLARAVFAYNREAARDGRSPTRGWHLPEDAEPGPVEGSVRNGLSRRKDQLPEVLDLLEEEIRTPVDDGPFPGGQRIQDLRRVWASLYIRLHGGYRSESSFRTAAAELQQPGLDAIDRALLVETFGTIGRDAGTPRELAFELYRPYLRAATGEEQAAAVSVASGTWDSGAIEDLRVVAYESPDAFVREGAFVLVARFLRYGSAYPPPRKDTTSPDWAKAHREAFDPEGLQRWNQGYDEWYREVHILAYGKPPEPAATVMRFDIPQDTETGIAQFAQAFFQVPADFEGSSGEMSADAVIVQARSGDLEAGSLRTARPVASSLAHELAHVLAGVEDNAVEALGSSEIPFAFPDASNPSVMNTFPFFRSLEVGSTVLTDCSGQSAGDVRNTTELCRRIIEGYACGAGRPAIDFTE